MSEFVSEPVIPLKGTSNAAAMARGEPGLPEAFDWRERTYKVVEVLERWKQSSREGGHAQGELYLRRHYYKLRMDDGTTWTVYLVRQTPKSGSPKRRWFLYSIDEPGAP